MHLPPQNPSLEIDALLTEHRKPMSHQTAGLSCTIRSDWNDAVVYTERWAIRESESVQLTTVEPICGVTNTVLRLFSANRLGIIRLDQLFRKWRNQFVLFSVVNSFISTKKQRSSLSYQNSSILVIEYEKYSYEYWRF